MNQSSCLPCNQPSRAFIQYDPVQTIPGNSAISGCHPSPYFECSKIQQYGTSIQPRIDPKARVSALNPLGLRYDLGYIKRLCPNSTDGCEETYIGANPLLVDAARGSRLLLDRPPLVGGVSVGNVPHDEIYTPQMSGYGKNYTSYLDITGGQIQYNINPSIQDVYYAPNFVTPSKVIHEIRMDPMGVVRPEYPRQPLTPYMWDPCHKIQCDSFTHDSLEFREDLMASQMRKQNEQRWEPRWLGKLNSLR